MATSIAPQTQSNIKVGGLGLIGRLFVAAASLFAAHVGTASAEQARHPAGGSNVLNSFTAVGPNGSAIGGPGGAYSLRVLRDTTAVGGQRMDIVDGMGHSARTTDGTPDWSKAPFVLGPSNTILPVEHNPADMRQVRIGGPILPTHNAGEIGGQHAAGDQNGHVIAGQTPRGVVGGSESHHKDEQSSNYRYFHEDGFHAYTNHTGDKVDIQVSEHDKVTKSIFIREVDKNDKDIVHIFDKNKEHEVVVHLHKHTFAVVTGEISARFAGALIGSFYAGLFALDSSQAAVIGSPGNVVVVAPPAAAVETHTETGHGGSTTTTTIPPHGGVVVTHNDQIVVTPCSPVAAHTGDCVRTLHELTAEQYDKDLAHLFAGHDKIPGRNGWTFERNANGSVTGTNKALGFKGTFFQDGSISGTLTKHGKEHETTGVFRNGQALWLRMLDWTYDEELGCDFAKFMGNLLSSDQKKDQGGSFFSFVDTIPPVGTPVVGVTDKGCVDGNPAAPAQVAPPATQQVVPPATQQVVPPATQQVVPPATQQVVPPATQQVVPPATQQVVPPATQQVVPPATQQVVPPATQQVVPPATQQVAPPATQQVVPPATQQVVPPATQQVVPPATVAPTTPGLPVPPPDLKKNGAYRPAHRPAPGQQDARIQGGFVQLAKYALNQNARTTTAAANNGFNQEQVTQTALKAAKTGSLSGIEGPYRDAVVAMLTTWKKSPEGLLKALQRDNTLKLAA